MTEQSEVLIEDEIIEETQTEETQVEEPEVTGEESEESKESEEEKHQSKSQNAKQRLRRKLRETEEANAALNEKLSALESKIDSVINPPAARPSRVDYDTEEEYEDALFDWRTPKSTTQKAEEPRPVKDDIVPKEIRSNWNKQADAAADKYDDFEEVVSNPNLKISDPMTFAIMESDKGGEIAYFLGNNPAEADRIFKLGFAAQVREIDKLEARFKKPTTNAPDPITPTKGTDTAVKDVSKMSMSEYAEYRNRQGL